jgi:hypothetical protein
MKYIKEYQKYDVKDRYRGLRDKEEWLKSKLYDIVDCSTDLTDLPYNFRHCGNFANNNDEEERLEEYLSIVNNTDKFQSNYSIKYSGEILGENVAAFCDGSYKNGKFTFNKTEANYKPITHDEIYSLDNKYTNLLKELLGGLEDTIDKLSNIIFKDSTDITFWINSYEVQRGTCVYVGIEFNS